MKDLLRIPIFAYSCWALLLGGSTQAIAHLPPAGVVIDFEDSDNPGLDPLPAAVFPAFGQFYLEEGVINAAIGFGSAPGASIGNIASGTSHLHGSRNVSTGNNASQLEADAGGGYFQLADGDVFSVLGLDIATLNLGLVGGGFSTLTFRGYTSADFSTAFDVVIGDDSAGNPVDIIGGLFETETGAGINGTHIHLDDVDEFGSIYLLEYFFDAPGRGSNPGTTPAFANLLVELDNVEFGPEVSAVPLPAAAYLFVSALFGLGVWRRKATSYGKV